MDFPKRIVSPVTAKVASVRILSLMTILVFLAMGCRLASHIPSLKNGFDLITQTPTTFEEPIFRDDFNGRLNPAWEWENEEASNYKVNQDGWLEITGGNESLLSDGQQTNLLWITLPEGNFGISIHLKSQPLFDNQRAGLLFYQDLDHYILLSQGYCMQCVLGGNGVFLEYNLAGIQGRYATADDATDLYLMLIIEQGAISAFYAIEAGEWHHIASLANDIHLERAALSVTNGDARNNGYDLIGMFDYFEIRRPTQIVPTPTPGSFQQA